MGTDFSEVLAPPQNCGREKGDMRLVSCLEPTKLGATIQYLVTRGTWHPGIVVSSFANYLQIVTFC
jgi:hypothetical protein